MPLTPLLPPTLTRTARYTLAAHAALLLAGLVAGLMQWGAHSPQHQFLGALALVVGIAALLAAARGRLHVGEALFIQCAALSTTVAAMGWAEAYRVFKPLTMLIAMLLLAIGPYKSWFKGRFGWILMGALAFSLAGDVLLLLPGRFVQGLIAFLIAHLFFIALFRLDAGWLACRLGLVAVLATSSAMYGFLWFNGMPSNMRGPVAAYMLVITLMVAQAIGRARTLRTRPAQAAALGAVLFMLSDSLLALNKFTRQLPLAQLWVLGTYYSAQFLILRHTRPTVPPTAATHPAQPPLSATYTA